MSENPDLRGAAPHFSPGPGSIVIPLKLQAVERRVTPGRPWAANVVPAAKVGSPSLPPITFALCPPDTQRPCRNSQRKQCDRCDERDGPETPASQAPCPRRERCRFDIRQAELRLVVGGFLPHEQQRCRPAMQGCDAHIEMCPSRPARPMLLICTARPRAGMPNVCARSRSRASAVRAAHPSTFGAPPSPGVHWWRFVMMSGPPFPPGR